MRALPLVLTVLVALALAVAAARPPAPRPVNTSADQFSAARALVDVRAIARAPHPTGSVEVARVRAYLITRLDAMGLAPREQAAPLTATGARRLARWGGDRQARVVNLVARAQGADPTAPAVAVMAHIDTVPGSPGAADDSAGVAAALEIVRALKAGPALRRDVFLVLTDGEELSSDGALAFFGGDPAAARIGAVVNLEARGGGGRAVMFETGAGNGAMMRLYAAGAPHPSANSLAVLVYRLMPNASDFSVAARRGLGGFNLAFLGRPEQYHTPLATPARLDPGALQHLGEQALGVVRALAVGDRLPERAPDAVFADLLGVRLIVYPVWGGWIVLGLAAGLIGFALWRVRPGWREVARGGAWGLALGLLGAALLNLSNRLSGAGPRSDYYLRLAAIPRLELSAAALSAGLMLALAIRPASLWGRWSGLLLLGFAMAAGVQLWAPAAGPVVAWPLLAAAVSAALAARFDPGLEHAPARLATAVIAAVALAQGLGLAHLAFLGVGPDLPEAMAGFALIAAMLLWPLAAPVAQSHAFAVAAMTLAVVGVGLALWVRLSPA